MRISIIKILWFPVLIIVFSTLQLPVTPGTARGGEGATVPDTIIMDDIQKEFGPVTFEHSMHVEIAENCGACHHIHNERVNSTCGDCHALDSAAFKGSATEGFPPCSSCHMDYSPEEPEVPGLKVALHKTCFGCHVGMGDLGVSPAGCAEMCHAR